MPERAMRMSPDAPFRLLVGVGGIGIGLFYALEGNHTLGRNESRPGRLLDVRDYCKLHIIAHYVAALLGADPTGTPFHVLPVGRVGQDQTGERLRDEMAAAGMDMRLVQTDRERPTTLGVCFQYPDGTGGNVTPTNSAASALTAADVDRAEPFFAANPGRVIALAAPEVPLAARLHLLELASRYRALRVAAFASAEIAEAQALGMLEVLDLLAVNEDEASVVAGEPFSAAAPRPFLDACAAALISHQPGVGIVLSAGKAGAYAFERGVWDHCPAPSVEVVNTAGAGDALLAGILACLAAGLPLISPGAPRATIGDRPLASALDLGVLLASFTVTSPHTIHPAANAGSLCAFARHLGLRFADPLGRLLGSEDAISSGQ